MWIPCRGAVRFGRAPVGVGSTSWDDANMDDFTFAGGNNVIASDYAAFAYGDAVTVSATAAVGMGYSLTVSGTAGFSNAGETGSLLRTCCSVATSDSPWNGARAVMRK